MRGSQKETLIRRGKALIGSSFYRKLFVLRSQFADSSFAAKSASVKADIVAFRRGKAATFHLVNELHSNASPTTSLTLYLG